MPNGAQEDREQQARRLRDAYERGMITEAELNESLAYLRASPRTRGRDRRRPSRWSSAWRRLARLP